MCDPVTLKGDEVKKFEVWMDSGANIHSKYKTTVSLDDLGISDEEWQEMTDEQRDVVMRDVAFERSDWGYREIE